METSAVEAVNVDEAFNLLAQNVFDKMESMGLVSRRSSGNFSNGSPGATQANAGKINTIGQPNRAVNLADSKQPINNSTKCC